jgi:tetratricopeptide (TPR) repeat protein
MTVDLVLHELQDARLIRPGSEPEPTFLFNHALVQETAYHSLLIKGRRELHRLVAAAFEQEYGGRLDDHVPTLAYHYWHAEDWQRAAMYSRRAGERAMQVFALREAIGYYAQALQALDRLPEASPQDTCDVILGWAQAAFGFEPFPKLLEQLTRAERLARQLGDKRRLTLVLHTIGRVHIAAGHPARADESLVEGFALATELGDDRLAVLPTFCMGMVTFDTDPRRALSFFDRAIELARKYADVDIEAYALGAKAMVQARLGESGESRESIEQALQIVGRVTSPMTDSDVYQYAGWAFLEMGDVRQGLEYAKLGVQKAVSADNIECACFGFACLGFGYLRAQEMTEAVQAFEEAIRRSRISGAEEAQVMGESGLGMAHLLSGHSEAFAELENALAHAQAIGKEFPAALLAQTLGEISLQRGHVEQSLTYLGAALDYYRRHRMRPYLARALELLADAFDRQGELDKAKQARSERTEVLEETAGPA